MPRLRCHNVSLKLTTLPVEVSLITKFALWVKSSFGKMVYMFIVLQRKDYCTFVYDCVHFCDLLLLKEINVTTFNSAITVCCSTARI